MNNTQLANLNTGKDDWCTPIELFNKLNEKYKFTLDPCSSEENHLCNKYYTKEQNGLVQDWSKDVVFMNPPYGRELPKWIKKAYEESQKGATVVCLIPARPDTIYWHDYIFPYANNIWFIKGRLHFSNSVNAAGFPSCIIEFTPNGKGFKNIVWNNK